MTHVQFNNRPVKFNKLFDEFFQFPNTWPNSSHVAGVPATNVFETPSTYHLELNAPGRNKEDFKINLDKDLLTISYEKAEEKTEESGVVRREFSIRSFKRSFSLDEKIDVNNIQAKYENGILKIDLPKKAEVIQEPKQISIS